MELVFYQYSSLNLYCYRECFTWPEINCRIMITHVLHLYWYTCYICCFVVGWPCLFVCLFVLNVSVLGSPCEPVALCIKTRLIYVQHLGHFVCMLHWHPTILPHLPLTNYIILLTAFHPVSLYLVHHLKAWHKMVSRLLIWNQWTENIYFLQMVCAPFA